MADIDNIKTQSPKRTNHNNINKKRLLILFAIPVIIFIAWVVFLDHTIRTTFDGKKWSVPSTVYARPLEVYVGAPISLQKFKTELTLLGYQFVNKVRKPGQVSVTNNQLNLYTLGFEFPEHIEPARNIKIQFKDDMISKLVSDDNVSLFRLSPVVIGGIYPTHNEDRLLVKLDEVPDTLIKMLVAVEDSDYYHHYGLSLRGIARAVVANIKGGGISQGASTLTQQLIKNYYLTADKTFSRKAQEALMAILLEFHFSKEAILEGYINEIYLGQDGPRAIHGFGLASQFYFRKPLSQLSIDQQALLVALVRGASYYNPARNEKRAQTRRDLVLDITVREGALEEDVALKAKAEPIKLNDKVVSDRKRYPAYLDLVRRQLKRDYNGQDLSSNGFSIYTHFDPVVQLSAETRLKNMVKKQENDNALVELEGAVVVTRPNTGAVIAVVGGSDARYAGFNRALDTKRQVGSLIKPAVYLTALQQPEKYNLATLLSDEEYSLLVKDEDPWTPQNYDQENHGEVLLYEALVKSYNVSTARLGSEIGLDNIIQTLHQLGIEQPIAALPSLTLGAVAMSPFDIAQMYQTLSADGFYTPLLAISSVVDQHNNILSRYPLAVEQRFNSESIYMLRHALRGVTHDGTGKALQWLLPDFTVAGKTGTTNELRDSWFAGFSGDMMSVVWLGKDDNSSTELTGSSGALRVWADIIKDNSDLPIQNIVPDNIEIVWVNKETGVGSQESCDDAIPLPFITDYAPVIEQQCNSGVRKVMDWFRGILYQSE